MSTAPALESSLQDVEIDLLLEGLYRVHGFDFRDYSRGSIKRRILELMRTEQLATVSEFQNRVFHDAACLERFLLGLSVHATAMFRDPSFYLTFRKRGGRLQYGRGGLFARDPAAGGRPLPKVSHLCHRHEHGNSPTST